MGVAAADGPGADGFQLAATKRSRCCAWPKHPQGGTWNQGVTREDGAVATAATVAAGGLGVLGCVRDTRRLVSAHWVCDTLSAGKYRLT